MVIHGHSSNWHCRCRYPFSIQTALDHWNTRPVWYSDTHSTLIGPYLKLTFGLEKFTLEPTQMSQSSSLGSWDLNKPSPAQNSLIRVHLNPILLPAGSKHPNKSAEMTKERMPSQSYLMNIGICDLRALIFFIFGNLVSALWQLTWTLLQILTSIT